MDNRQRVLSALRNLVPDKVPFEMELCAEKLEELDKKNGTRDFEEFFNQPVRWSRTPYYKHTEKTKQNAETLIEKKPDYADAKVDEWGIGSTKMGKYHFLQYVHPLSGDDITVKDIEQYPFPKIREEITEELSARTELFHQKGHAVISHICTIGGIALGALNKLRGMEQIMMDIAINPMIIEALLEKLRELNFRLIDRVISSGCDIVFVGDDYAMQRGMLMSKESFDSLFKKHIGLIVDYCKKLNPDIIVAHHCDGNCEKIIPDFIELGVDVLNPLQPECMDIYKIKKTFGRDIAFWGSLSTQKTLPFGTPAQVEQEVREIIEGVGKDGGLMLAPAHIIEPEVPWENIYALLNAIDKYGRY